MSRRITAVAEVFSAEEIAQAAGVSVREAGELIAAGRIRTIDAAFIPQREAVRAVRLLRGQPVAERRELFRPRVAPKRSPGRALLASGGLHAAMLGILVLVSTLGASTSVADLEPPKPVRLVFLAKPGPGGGGGGGGLKMPAPPPKVQMKGAAKLRSPIPRPRPITTRKPEPPRRPLTPPVRPAPVPRPVEPPPPVAPPAPLPQVVAPVVASAADPRDRSGVLESASDAPSQGPGSGSGAGSGHGTGMGEGDGSGIGPGSGGGMGGGPYRPGAGITPPQLLREVKPEYTEDARRRGIEGDVVLEIVVRRDGSVGDLKVLQGLGAGLDRRAIDAVRQWRFSPAKRFGTPVDVMVEVAVEFKLR